MTVVSHGTDAPAAGARGFTRGSTFTRDGTMVASTAREDRPRLVAGKPAGE